MGGARQNRNVQFTARHRRQSNGLKISPCVKHNAGKEPQGHSRTVEQDYENIHGGRGGQASPFRTMSILNSIMIIYP